MGSSTFPLDTQRLILDRMKRTAAKRVCHGLGCVEDCFKELEQLVRALAEQERKQEAETGPGDATTVMGSNENSKIPFPRTCGARFAPNGKLVVFRNATYEVRLQCYLATNCTRHVAL